tara:strand:+ start:506 stop:691 length:186 start_codon:yes stop_codon:yes gene_type:complete
MKVGDLVKQYILYNDGIVKDVEYGVIIETIDKPEFSVCKILWPKGLSKTWSENIEVISASR